MKNAAEHSPVLLAEVGRILALREGDTYLDCTAGLGGHAASMASVVGPSGLVILNDLDAGNLAQAKANVLASAAPMPPRVETIHGAFADVLRQCAMRGFCASAMLADLGFASPHVDDPERGFSFARDGPLDMRYDQSGAITAADLVGGLSERELAEIIRSFGEDRCAGRIAAKIAEGREAQPITTTGRLARIVRSALPAGGGGIDPATRTFQALRIAVNDEIGNLQALLASIEQHAVAQLSELCLPSPTGQETCATGPLAPGARIAIVSFHSLEDRPVKQAFARMVDRGLAQHLTPGPVRASAEEVGDNVRARSARLRAIALTGGA